ncbi:MAG TPA: hypothetical protein VK177_21760 [Flavobacteriales bacterium]|nr:hypothetical protein [Flavobacteriales bacterium]
MRKYIVIAAALLVAGCEKENMNARQTAFTTSPVIRLQSPTQNQIFNNNDVVVIDGVARDNDLESGLFEIKDKITGQVYFRKKIRFDTPGMDNSEPINGNNGRFHLLAPIHIPAGAEKPVTLVIEVLDKMQHNTVLRVPLRVRPLLQPIEGNVTSRVDANLPLEDDVQTRVESDFPVNREK